jgi:hypothetical protein
VRYDLVLEVLDEFVFLKGNLVFTVPGHSLQYNTLRDRLLIHHSKGRRGGGILKAIVGW